MSRDHVKAAEIADDLSYEYDRFGNPTSAAIVSRAYLSLLKKAAAESWKPVEEGKLPSSFCGWLVHDPGSDEYQVMCDEGADREVYSNGTIFNWENGKLVDKSGECEIVKFKPVVEP